MEILCRTNKNIMGIEYNEKLNCYEFIYMLRDQLLEKNDKNILIKEYITGVVSKDNKNRLLNNDLSVLQFIQNSYHKKRIVEINCKKTYVKDIKYINTQLSMLPTNEIYFKDLLK